MTMVEFIILVIIFGGIYIATKSTEWKSNNRPTPKGYHTNWTQANIDIATKGKDYYYKKHLSGGYDVPDKKN